jgi:hypothetical protein
LAGGVGGWVELSSDHYLRLLLADWFLSSEGETAAGRRSQPIKSFKSIIFGFVPTSRYSTMSCVELRVHGSEIVYNPGADDDRR